MKMETGQAALPTFRVTLSLGQKGYNDTLPQVELATTDRIQSHVGSRKVLFHSLHIKLKFMKQFIAQKIDVPALNM